MSGFGGLQPYHFYCSVLFSWLQMASKCKINGETLTLTFVCIGQIFQPYHFKMVFAVSVNTVRAIGAASWILRKQRIKQSAIQYNFVFANYKSLKTEQLHNRPAGTVISRQNRFRPSTISYCLSSCGSNSPCRLQ